MEFFYDPVNDKATDPDKLTIVSNNGGSSWVDLANAGTTPAPSVITGTFTAFGVFSMANQTGGGNTLPVSMLSFTMEKKGQGALAKWSTASEKNNSHFTLERTRDGINFEEVGSIRGAGTTYDVRNYEYLDADFHAQKASTIYYRVKQTDFDGKFTYSALASLSKEKVNMLTVTPNLFEDRFTVFTNQAVKSLEVYNAAGTLVHIQPTENNSDADISSYKVSLPEVPSGMYVLVLRRPDGSGDHKKIVKK
jgi:hypothetical protein